MDDNLERGRKIDTAALSDAMDKLGIAGQCLGIKPVEGSFRLAGRARTVLYAPASTPAGSVGDYIDDIEPGSVVALDNGGRLDATVWGDILTYMASTKGVAGTVIDGVCRDVQLCRDLNYPVFSRGWWMRTGKDRVQVERYDAPISIGGARVSPGDLLIGDADGVVCLPRHEEDRILDAAEAIAAVEDEIRARIRDGMRLDAARQDLGYHSLQTLKK